MSNIFNVLALNEAFLLFDIKKAAVKTAAYKESKI